MHPLGSESHIKASQKPGALTIILLKMFSGSPHFSIFNPIHVLYEPATTEKTGLEPKEWFLVVQGEAAM